LSIYNRIKQKRIELGMTQQDLAEKVGLKTKGAISRIESGDRDINQRQVIDFAKALHTTPAYLMGWEEEANSIGVFLNYPIYKAPLYESVSAGFGAYANDLIVDYIPIFVGCENEAKKTLCIRVSGDSMFPKIEEGDIIQVNTDEEVKNGDIAVLLIDNEEGVVKKIIIGNNFIELHSFNPMYPVRKFIGTEISRLKIVGKVKKVIKSF